jgi:hypothetical protein
MIGKNHVVATEIPETVEFDRDAWCRDAGEALARSIDKLVLECLTSPVTISGTCQSSRS